MPGDGRRPDDPSNAEPHEPVHCDGVMVDTALHTEIVDFTVSRVIELGPRAALWVVHGFRNAAGSRCSYGRQQRQHRYATRREALISDITNFYTAKYTAFYTKKRCNGRDTSYTSDTHPDGLAV